MDEKNTKYPAVLPLDQYWPYLVTVLADATKFIAWL